MGICPKKFGPYFWGALHLACLYGGDPKVLESFAQSYLEVLPCPACRIHFAQVLQDVPFPVNGTREEIFKWSVVVHNVVNARLDKPQVTFDQALATWTSGCDDDPILDWPTVGAIVALAALVVFLLRNK